MNQVLLTRRVTFSSGHRYWKESLSPSENRALYGELASPFNHGHNYVLWCSISGSVDETNGMVINIKDLDDILQQRIVSKFDQKSINDQVVGFENTSPCLENLLKTFSEVLSDIAPGVHLAHLKLEEFPGFYAELNNQDRKMTLTRSYEFAAAHRLHVPTFSDDKNWELYGKCNNPSGHGHNYVVEVTVSGNPDPETGFLVDLRSLDQVVEAEIIERYDHEHLNCDVPELEGKNPTTEVVTIAIWNRLDGKVPGTLERVKLSETDRSFFEVNRG